MPIAFQGQAPQIRVKSFKPAKFKHLAEKVVAAGLNAADPFGECNYSGRYQAPSERVRAALRPELVLTILPPARHKDYLRLLAFQVTCIVAGDVDNPEMNLLSEADIKRLGERYNSWLMSFACQLEAIPALDNQ